MQETVNFMELILHNIVEISTMLMEFIGVLVLVSTALKCFINWLQKKNNVRLPLAQGIALALEFKLGGEVLRTVVVREWSELGILGAIIVLRGLLTFLIHWEIKTEQQALERSMNDEQGSRQKFAATQENSRQQEEA